MAIPDITFLDTSGWIAILNIDDQFHRAAVENLQEFGRSNTRLVTTDWVVAETGNGLARTNIRSQFPAAVQAFLRSKQSRLVRIGDELRTAALELYEAMSDKSWGLVDCASFVVMRREGIEVALTADRHFQQAGFQSLLNIPG
jgi:uncharacterized protein